MDREGLSGAVQLSFEFDSPVSGGAEEVSKGVGGSEAGVSGLDSGGGTIDN